MINKTDFLCVEDTTFKYDHLQNDLDNTWNFTYETSSKKIATISFSLEEHFEELLIQYRTNIFSEEVIIKASEKAHQLQELLYNHPEYRLRKLLKNFSIRLGDFLIRDLHEYKENVHQSFTSEQSVLLYTIYENSLTKLKQQSGVPIFKVITCGSQGFYLAKAIKDLGIGDYKMLKGSIFSIDFGLKNGDKHFTHDFITKLQELGYPIWYDYTWDSPSVK